jgi:predicted nucleic acid-binding Zn ribbon protein
MEKLDKILRQSIKKNGLRKPLEGAEICFYAGLWGNGQFTPISFLNGILKVSVSSSSAASELDMKRSELIDFINDKIGKRVVRNLRIIVL